MMDKAEKNLNFNCVECNKTVDFPDEDCMGEHCLDCYWKLRDTGEWVE
tara:strand:+ start:349 stop:492 length:144 start_codon:yes stop_codon:yes gene_type:complete